MHELHALSRLALIRHRWELRMLLATSGIGLAIAALLWLRAADRTDVEVAGLVLRVVLLPIGLAGAILFDYAQGGDLISPASGCHHWLLRQPVKSWKIAIVPVVLKTFWISASWLLFAASLRVMGVPVPLITPCFYFSGAAIWLMVVSWKPLRSGWHRLVWLAICLTTCYVMLWLVMGSLQIEDHRWRFWVIIAGQIFSLTLYATAVLAAIRVVAMARTAPTGIFPADARRDSAWPRHVSISTEQIHTSPLQALAWNEFANINRFTIRTLLIGVLPAIWIAGCLLSLHPATLVLVLMAFAYLAGVSICGSHDSTTATGSTLPAHLLTSPFTSAQLAWTRAAVWLGVVASVFSCVVFVFGLWSLWPSNRQTWMQWASDQAAALGGELRPGTLGLRLSFAVVLAAAVLAISRIVAYWWIGMSGRKGFIVMLTSVATTVYLIPLALFLRWFMVQTQWSEVQATLANWLSWAPQIIAGLLILKTAATAVVAAISLRAQVVSPGTIGRAVSCWMMLVLLIGTALAMLIPHPSATLVACWGAVALTIPLARVLVMPLMVDWNRHR